MSLSSSQMQAQAKPAEDIEDIIELQADVTKVPLEQIIELKDVPLWTGWYWIGGGALLLIALLVLLFTRKRKSDSTASVSQIPPHEKALQELRDIWSDQEELDDKIFVITVSDVLRRYIEAAFSIRAPERTTEEFLEEASQHEDLKGDFADRLDEFLSIVDLVKFARMPLASNKREELHESAVNFVEESHQAMMLKIAPELSTSAQMLGEKIEK